MIHRLAGAPFRGLPSVLQQHPQFDLHGLRRVMALRLESGPEGAFDLIIDFTHTYASDTLFRLHCAGIRNCVIPSLSPTFYVSEVEVEDVSASQLEGIRMHLKDFGANGSLEVWCRALEVGLVVPVL
jgi:hypothetical protein